MKQKRSTALSSFQPNGKSSQRSPLSTLTDLPPKSVKKITQTLNVLVADAFALYVKTKNFHWHLYGRQFRDYHLLFDEQAGDILASVDTLAERVRKVGGTTIKSIDHIGRLQTISDDDDELVSADEMILRLLSDNLQMAKSQRDAIDICEQERDTPSANILQDLLDKTERRVWFLFELSQ